MLDGFCLGLYCERISSKGQPVRLFGLTYVMDEDPDDFNVRDVMRHPFWSSGEALHLPFRLDASFACYACCPNMDDSRPMVHTIHGTLRHIKCAGKADRSNKFICNMCASIFTNRKFKELHNEIVSGTVKKMATPQEMAKTIENLNRKVAKLRKRNYRKELVAELR